MGNKYDSCTLNRVRVILKPFNLVKQSWVKLKLGFVQQLNRVSVRAVGSVRMNLFFDILNIVIVVVGIIGNSLVIAVVKKTRSMRTTTNFLLVNLAISDIVTLLLNPFLHELMWPEHHSDYICKCLTGNGLVALPVSVSMFTLVIIAVERYHALVKPMATRLRLTQENFHYAIIGTWCVSVALNIPIFVDYRYDREERRCKGVWKLDMSNWMAKYIIFFSVIYLISALVIGYCYFEIFRGLFITNTICPESTTTEEERKSKKKLAKLLLFVAVLFYICYLPFHIFVMCKASGEKGNYDLILFQSFAFLAFFNCCLNPIVYAFQSSNYRTGFKRIFRCQSTNGVNNEGPQN